jgi:hypothetical protein
MEEPKSSTPERPEDLNSGFSFAGDKAKEATDKRTFNPQHSHDLPTVNESSDRDEGEATDPQDANPFPAATINEDSDRVGGENTDPQDSDPLPETVHKSSYHDGGEARIGATPSRESAPGQEGAGKDPTDSAVPKGGPNPNGNLNQAIENNRIIEEIIRKGQPKVYEHIGGSGGREISEELSKEVSTDSEQGKTGETVPYRTQVGGIDFREEPDDSGGDRGCSSPVQRKVFETKDTEAPQHHLPTNQRRTEGEQRREAPTRRDERPEGRETARGERWRRDGRDERRDSRRDYGWNNERHSGREAGRNTDRNIERDGRAGRGLGRNERDERDGGRHTGQEGGRDSRRHDDKFGGGGRDAGRDQVRYNERDERDGGRAPMRNTEGDGGRDPGRDPGGRDPRGRDPGGRDPGGRDLGGDYHRDTGYRGGRGQWASPRGRGGYRRYQDDGRRSYGQREPDFQERGGYSQERYPRDVDLRDEVRRQGAGWRDQGESDQRGLRERDQYEGNRGEKRDREVAEIGEGRDTGGDGGRNSKRSRSETKEVREDGIDHRPVPSQFFSDRRVSNGPSDGQQISPSPTTRTTGTTQTATQTPSQDSSSLSLMVGPQFREALARTQQPYNTHPNFGDHVQTSVQPLPGINFNFDSFARLLEIQQNTQGLTNPTNRSQQPEVSPEDIALFVQFLAQRPKGPTGGADKADGDDERS